MRPSEADKYRRMLRHARLAVRRAGAAGALADDPRPDTDAALMDALSDGKATVRLSVIQALLHRDPHRAMEPIVQRVRQTVRGSAPEPYAPPSATELVELHLEWCDRFPLVELFTEALRDGDESARWAAVVVLRWHRDKPAAAAALQAAAEGDRSAAVRKGASKALRQRGLRDRLPFGPPAVGDDRASTEDRLR